jgi:ribosome-interacting GTPase 1
LDGLRCSAYNLLSRLNKKPPPIKFKKKDKGGINLTTSVPQKELDLETVRTILGEYKVHCADVHLQGEWYCVSTPFFFCSSVLW